MMLDKITRSIKENLKRMQDIEFLRAMDSDVCKICFVLLAITLLSYQATDLFYKIVRFPLIKQTAGMQSSGIPRAAASPQRQMLQDYAVISDRNLFLTTMKTAGGDESEQGLSDSGQAMADLDLKGTVAGASPFGFIVVEERASKKQKLYRLGDNIGSNKLVGITRNAATLRSGDREITLRIKETIEGSLISQHRPPQRDAGSSRNIQLSQQAVAEKLSDLKTIMKNAVIRPFLNEGVQEGFIISNIAGGSIYEKMGLRNGDIIIDVNNEPIEGAGNLMELMSSLQTGSGIELSIRRNNNMEKINYTFH
jgi:general secretion pathway protein C